ncbi:MAG: hypothetical protein RBR59_02925 [Sulfurimonadaceae bacterium]|nr:hypothetical protein [Sulfurimonadaceae bacterium]
MCLVIASVLFVLSYNLFQRDSLVMACVSFVTGVFFLLLMGKNIYDTKKRKESEKHDS